MGTRLGNWCVKATQQVGLRATWRDLVFEAMRIGEIVKGENGPRSKKGQGPQVRKRSWCKMKIMSLNSYIILVCSFAYYLTVPSRLQALEKWDSSLLGYFAKCINQVCYSNALSNRLSGFQKLIFFYSPKRLILLQVSCGSDSGINLLSFQVERSDSVMDAWFSEREKKQALLRSREPKRSCLGAYPILLTEAWYTSKLKVILGSHSKL